MAILDPIVVNEKKELPVPDFNKKEVEGIAVDAVKKEIAAGNIPTGTKLYLHTVVLKNFPTYTQYTLNSDGTITVSTGTFESYGDKKLFFVSTKSTAYTSFPEKKEVVSQSASLGTYEYSILGYEISSRISVLLTHGTNSFYVASVTNNNIDSDTITEL